MEERELSNLNYNILYCIYLPSALYYCLQIANDPVTNLIFLFILILITSIFQQSRKKILLYIIMIITITEFILKILIIADIIPYIDPSYFHLQIHKNILSISQGLFSMDFIVYCMMVWSSCILPVVYNSNEYEQSGEYFRFLKTISNTLEFITPFLIYILCFTKLTSKSFRQWLQNLSPQLQFSNYEMLQQVSWGLITILFLIFNKERLYLRKYLTILIIILIVRDHYIQHNSSSKIQLYNLQPMFIEIIKTAIILFFRIHNQTISNIDSTFQQEVDELSSNRKSSYKKFTIKKKLTFRSQRNEKYVIFLLILTIITMIMTNGLGNVIIIIGLFVNIPQYIESSFRNYIAIGITISFLLQPNQFIYFFYLYIVRYISTFDYTFQNQNLYILVQVSRMVVLLSKVSVLNFFIGLFQSKYLIVFTLIFRTIFSYYNMVLVFMGTQDNYSFIVQYFIPSSIFRDLQLWVYLIVLKLYSPASTIKFRGTDITNIFQQYKILNKFQKGLKILKVFHWIAYITISLIILNREPSLFTILRIIPFLLSFVFGIFQSQKTQCSLILWNWNFYTALSIFFVKYFYLLSKYDNLSPWLITILNPLMENHSIIGLISPDDSKLWIDFGPDFIVILINAIIIYLIKVQLEQIAYNIQKQRIMQQQNLQNPLILPHDQKQHQKNIHYLYNNYIKPIQYKFKQKSRFRHLFTDFILDIYFIIFLLIFYCTPDHNYQYIYLIHFVIFFYGYFTQQNKANRPIIFRLMIGIGSLDILILYLTYFFNLTNQENHYNIQVVLSKYLVLIVAILFYYTNQALCKFYTENKVVQIKENSYLLFKMMAPLIPYEKIKKEIIILYMHFFKILSLSYFIAIIISQQNIFQWIHAATLSVIVAMKLLSFRKGHHHKQFDKILWVYYCKAGIFLDLFAGIYFNSQCSIQAKECQSSSSLSDAIYQNSNNHFYLIGFIFLRAYSMMVQQFNIVIRSQLYGVKGTPLQQFHPHLDKKISEIQKKYGERRLQIIEEVRSIRQNSQCITFATDKQANWVHRNIYATIIWILPLIFIIILILGITQYLSGFYGYVMFLLALIALAYYLKKLQTITIENIFLLIFMKLIFLVFLISLADKFILNILYDDYYKSKHFFLGAFCMIFGFMGYYQIYKHIQPKNDIYNHHHLYLLDFILKRSYQAIQYWRAKCQMVSELGSQIHNQKKMIHLKKFHLNKQKLSTIITQLSSELKLNSSNRKQRFEHFSTKQIAQQLKQKQQFQIYSNMLSFMSIEDLEYCYLNLNLYYKKEGVESSENLFQVSKKMREDILMKYQDSISLKDSLVKYLDTLHQKLESRLKQQKKEMHEQNILEKPEEQLQQKILSKTQIKDQINNKHSNKFHVEENEVNDDQSVKLLQKVCQQQCNEKLVNKESQSMDHDLCGQRIDKRLKELNLIIRYIVQNSQIIGLVVIAGWNFYGGVYTIPANIAIFAWAIVLQSKTTVIFWFFLLTYSSAILSFKFILHTLPKHFFFDFLFYYHPTQYFYEFIIIFTCAVQIVLLKFGGTSEIPYSQRQNIYDSFYRSILNQTSVGPEKPHMNEFLNIYKKLTKSIKHSFIHRVFSKGRLKPGKDLYPSLAIVQVIILFYIFFFYDMMQFQSKNNRKSLGQILTVTKFSKNMILALFFQVIILIADRLIVSLNIIDQAQQKLQNYIFNVAFSNEIKEHQPLSQQQLQKVNKFDYLLIIKYVFHVILLFFINFLVYFYIPSGGLEKSIIPKCQNAVCGKSYTYLSGFLFLYLIYFVFSGLQIKHGFNRNKCKNTLMQKYHWINYYIYMLFTGIPFLWQFKKISDWTTTSTALPLFHWMKFQDINARMYQSKCQSEILRIKPLGKGPWYKLLMGPPGFIFILALIFSPIIMYSSYNPFAIQDTIQASTFKFHLIMDEKSTYQFFQTSITSISNSQQYNGFNKEILGLFDRASLFKITASNFPDKDFMLSQPAVNRLLSHLNKTYYRQNIHKFQFKLLIVVSEKQGGQTEIQWGSKMLNPQQILGLYNIISQGNEYSQLKIINFYSPLPGQITNITITLNNVNFAQYFQLKIKQQPTSQLQSQQTSQGLYIFYKSEVKYKAAIGLLTFYLTYVVLINSLFRFYFTGGLQIILFEGCQQDKILFLCDAVRSARILQNFYQEEYLYFSLVDLMRYPGMIKNITSDFSNLRQKEQIKQKIQ